MISYKITIVVILLFLCPIVLLAQQDISVLLRVNDKEKATVYHDQPLIISVSISNPKASEDGQWNRAADRGLADLKERLNKGELSGEKYKEEKQKVEEAKKNIQTITIGSGSRPVYQSVQFKWRDAQGATIDSIYMKFLDSSSAPVQFILDADAYYTLRWGVDRKVMLRMKTGKYFLTATIDSYHSDDAELVVRSLSIPKSSLATISMQTELGRFALSYGLTDTAVFHAKNILKINPSSIDGLVLLGEANIQNKNYKEASGFFESALKNFYKQYPKSSEPPEYILGMIQLLKDKGF